MRQQQLVSSGYLVFACRGASDSNYGKPGAKQVASTWVLTHPPSEQSNFYSPNAFKSLFRTFMLAGSENTQSREVHQPKQTNISQN